jgi:hypothetical protein
MLEPMKARAERAFLAELESRIAAGEQAEVELSLALIAGQGVHVDQDELRGARRRSLELLAAGGDPRRQPDPDGRAVSALAADLSTPDRRAELVAGLAALRPTVEELPRVTARLERLLGDEEQAWRLFAYTLLAEELLNEE